MYDQRKLISIGKNPHPDIEQTLHKRSSQANLRDTGSVEDSIKVDHVEETAKNQQRSISEYAWLNLENVGSSIIHPPVVVNNFELKPNFIHMVQQMCHFDGFQEKSSRAMKWWKQVNTKKKKLPISPQTSTCSISWNFCEVHLINSLSPYSYNCHSGGHEWSRFHEPP